MSVIEWVAAAFGLACVGLTTRRSLWCWPTGLVQVTLYAVVFARAKLYSDVALHLIYIGLNLYGWLHWRSGGGAASTLPVTRLSSKGRWICAAVGVVGSLILGSIMAKGTDAALPYPDATIAVLSLIAQYLMARKVVENWPIWIVVDGIGVWVYWSKQLHPTALLYAVFLILSVVGYAAWSREVANPGKPSRT